MVRCIVTLLTLMFVQSTHAATLLIWGDSLSAGYGLATEAAWPHLLDLKLVHEGYRYRLENASISGETTAGGLARLPAALKQYKPTIIVIELGANDGLRGLPLAAMQENLRAMITAAQSAGAKVLLVGIRMPPNFGPVYTEKFQNIYVELAKEKHTRLLPFMMEGFAEKKDLFQDDGIHPAASAQPMVLANIWFALKPLLAK
jgi:acyl-CoA thioesterase I